MADTIAQIDNEIEFLVRSIQEQKNAQAQLQSMQDVLQRIIASLGPNVQGTSQSQSQLQYSCPRGGTGASGTMNSGPGGQYASSYGPSSEGTSGSTIAEARFNIRPPNSSYGTGSCSSGQQSTLAQCQFNINPTDGSCSSRATSASHPGNSYFSGHPSSGTGTSGSTYAAFHHQIHPGVGGGGGSQSAGGSYQAGMGNGSGQTCSSGTTVEQYRYFVNPDGSGFTSSNPYTSQGTGTSGNQGSFCSQCAQRMGCPSNRNMAMASLPLQVQPPPFFSNQPQPYNRRTI